MWWAGKAARARTSDDSRAGKGQPGRPFLRDGRHLAPVTMMSESSRPRLLRKRNWPCRLLAVPFFGGCAGVVCMVAIYHWPRANVPVYYFALRPAFLWFALLLPLLLVGILALRLRWFLMGLLVWGVGLGAAEEVLQCLKLSPAQAREAFSAARMGALSNPAEEQQSVPLRIVTWNVKGGTKGADEAVAQLASLKPDIVLMQEFGNWRMQAAIEGSSYFQDYHLGETWRTVLSRFPVSRVRETPLSRDLGSVWRVEVAPGVHITCVSVHLSKSAIKTQLIRGWSWRGLQEAVARSERELEQVGAALALHAEEGAVILAGDFNLPVGYPPLRAATATLKDCFSANGYGWGKTALARFPAVRIDMIFVPHDAEVYYASAVPTRFSDHYMALTEVVVPVRAGKAEPLAASAATTTPSMDPREP